MHSKRFYSVDEKTLADDLMLLGIAGSLLVTNSEDALIKIVNEQKKSMDDRFKKLTNVGNWDIAGLRR